MARPHSCFCSQFALSLISSQAWLLLIQLDEMSRFPELRSNEKKGRENPSLSVFFQGMKPEELLSEATEGIRTLDQGTLTFILKGEGSLTGLTAGPNRIYLF